MTHNSKAQRNAICFHRFSYFFSLEACSLEAVATQQKPESTVLSPANLPTAQGFTFPTQSKMQFADVPPFLSLKSKKCFPNIQKIKKIFQKKNFKKHFSPSTLALGFRVWQPWCSAKNPNETTVSSTQKKCPKKYLEPQDNQIFSGWRWWNNQFLVDGDGETTFCFMDVSGSRYSLWLNQPMVKNMRKSNIGSFPQGSGWK